MFVEEIRRVLSTTPRGRLCDLSSAVWKGFAAGAVSETDAQALAEAIEARKAIPAALPQPRRWGSRPRSPESMERRRRWTSSGWLPPQLASRFTMAENAVLSVIAAEVSRRGQSMLTIGAIAGLAGVCKATVKTAIREAKALGLLTSEEWRITAWRNAPNTVRIVSKEWSSWIRMRTKRDNTLVGGGGKSLIPTNTKQDSGEKRRGGGGFFKKKTSDKSIMSVSAMTRVRTAGLTIKLDATEKPQAV